MTCIQNSRLASLGKLQRTALQSREYKKKGVGWRENHSSFINSFLCPTERDSTASLSQVREVPSPCFWQLWKDFSHPYAMRSSHTEKHTKEWGLVFSLVQPAHALVQEPFSPCTNKDYSNEKPLFTSMTWSLLSWLLFPLRLSFKRLLSKIEELQSALKKKTQKKKEHCGPAHATINHTRQSRSLLKPKQALLLISLWEDKWWTPFLYQWYDMLSQGRCLWDIRNGFRWKRYRLNYHLQKTQESLWPAI